MIRPSALSLAEKCGYSVTLAGEFRESSDAAERGTAFHKEAAAHINGVKASARVGRMLATFAAIDEKVEAERPVALVDDDFEVLSEGTADVIVTHADGSITVVDWKTGMPEKVDEPDENLQILVYGLAAAIARGAPRFKVGLYFTEHPPIRLSAWIDTADAGWIMDRVRNALARDRNEPVVGAHCSSCYRRTHCKAWLLPAYEGETALAPFTQPGGLSAESAPKALHVLQAMQDAVKIAEAHLRDYARDNGGIRSGSKVWGPMMVRGGRRSVSIDAIPQEMLDALERVGAVREGRPYETYRWRNATADGDKRKDTSRED
jgi:hypothetical protein